jgi:hypothetical protein
VVPGQSALKSQRAFAAPSETAQNLTCPAALFCAMHAIGRRLLLGRTIVCFVTGTSRAF